MLALHSPPATSSEFDTLGAWLDFLQPHWLPHNQIRLLQSGKEYFPALCAACALATKTIYLETYIFNDDKIGQQVQALLTQAARRGVQVRVVVDGFGTPAFPSAWLQEWAAAGVAWRVFRPEGKNWLWRWRWGLTANRQRLRRLHRKIVVIDGTIAFVGGINIQDDYLHQNGSVLAAPRFDYAVQIQGDLLQPLSTLTLRQWWQLDWWQYVLQHSQSASHTSERVAIERREHWRQTWQDWWLRIGANLRYTRRAQRPQPGELKTVSAALVLRDNLRYRHSIENAYLAAIQAAQEEIVLANAYFFPGLRFRYALCAAAKRGVKVTLLLQGQSEHLIQFYGSQVLYRELLQAGIKIYEYQPSFLHAKVAVIDPHSASSWATVGSSNIDPYSLLLAREANIMVRAQDFARTLHASLLAALQQARAVKLEDLARLPWWRRAVSWLGYGCLRLGLSLSGLSDQYQK